MKNRKYRKSSIDNRKSNDKKSLDKLMNSMNVKVPEDWEAGKSNMSEEDFKRDIFELEKLDKENSIKENEIIIEID